jgi:hypothetical protein
LPALFSLIIVKTSLLSDHPLNSGRKTGLTRHGQKYTFENSAGNQKASSFALKTSHIFGKNILVYQKFEKLNILRVTF